MTVVIDRYGKVTISEDYRKYIYVLIDCPELVIGVANGNKITLEALREYLNKTDKGQ